MTSTGDLILGPGLLLYSQPKTVLQLLIFTVKVIFETRRARKALSASERMNSNWARSTGTWFCDKILPCAWNLNSFALSLYSANWREHSLTISILTWSLKDSLKNLVECLQPLCFQTSGDDVVSSGWSLLHAFQRGKLWKSHLFHLSQQKRVI